MKNSMCHDEGKIQHYFVRKTMMRVPHTICSPELSPCNFWLSEYARDQVKDQRITSEDDLERALTNIWEKGSIDLCQSVSHGTRKNMISIPMK
jgi:hypothetical protein